MHILAWFGPREFFLGLEAKWLADLQEFLHNALPKILVRLIGAWVLTRVLKLITGRIIKVAERRSSRLGHIGSINDVTCRSSIGLLDGCAVAPFVRTGFSVF